MRFTTSKVVAPLPSRLSWSRLDGRALTTALSLVLRSSLPVNRLSRSCLSLSCKYSIELLELHDLNIYSSFFMWGFAYGLLDVLNSRFQVALHITQGESSGLQAAYFGAYFVGPLTYSGWFLRRFGYRYTFILGLSIYCVGALMFWPSAVKRSFGGFCGAMFLAGSGLSTLEVSANPYIAGENDYLFLFYSHR
jgi:hypothetical protein